MWLRLSSWSGDRGLPEEEQVGVLLRPIPQSQEACTGGALVSISRRVWKHPGRAGPWASGVSGPLPAPDSCPDFLIPGTCRGGKGRGSPGQLNDAMATRCTYKHSGSLPGPWPGAGCGVPAGSRLLGGGALAYLAVSIEVCADGLQHQALLSDQHGPGFAGQWGLPGWIAAPAPPCFSWEA